MESADLLIAGAGAAGLAAAIFASEAAAARLGAATPTPRIVLLDGARRPGAKILVSGGGRCNVTNARATPEDYNGGPRPIIRRILSAFDSGRAADWMRSIGVELKEEDNGKMFPVTDQARTVLNALLRRVDALGGVLKCGVRILDIRPLAEGGFGVWTQAAGEGEGAEGGKGASCAMPAMSLVSSSAPFLTARRVILATGGLALPKSGSDGAGLEIARRLGHSVIPTTPALCPLVLRASSEPGGRFAEFSGMALSARLLLVCAKTGKTLHEELGSCLFTHFGLSGPVVLNFSRHWLRARLERPEEPVVVCLGHPSFRSVEESDTWLRDEAVRHPRRTVATALEALYPERFARALAPRDLCLGNLPRQERRRLANNMARMLLDVAGDRGYAFAEVTAGGVDLREIDPKTTQSRLVPGLYFCGEILDVDGKIGGFNFQWAWSSAYVAGNAAISMERSRPG